MVILLLQRKNETKQVNWGVSQDTSWRGMKMDKETKYKRENIDLMIKDFLYRNKRYKIKPLMIARALETLLDNELITFYEAYKIAEKLK